jgi:polysaccharide export outer membrane protein
MKAFTVLLLMVSALLTTAWAQNAESGAAARSGMTGTSGTIAPPDDEYRIGPSDVIEIYILKVPELSREYKVGSDGSIEMPFLGRIDAQNRTSRELATLLVGRLNQGYLVDPQVAVMVKQMNRRFFVQGAVRSPGVYTLAGRPSLLELISVAGGLNPTYSGTAFILRDIRPRQSAAGTPTDAASVDTDPDLDVQPQYEMRKSNINALLRGEFSENVTIEPGDIVHIPPADIFFVAGSVKAPGSFTLKEGTTLRQAVSLAQGATATASPGRAVIFRETSTGQKQEIPVDVGAVMSGNKDDILILANDIIVIPSNKAKSVFYPVLSAFGAGAAWAAVTIIP